MLGLFFFLARRSLLKSRLTLVLLLGAVAAGVGFQVPNTANLEGYTAALLDMGVSSGFGDVRVRPARGASFDDGDALASALAQTPGVRSVAPLLTLPGAIGKSGHFLSAPVMGIDGHAPNRPYQMTEGRVLAAGESDGLVLGSALADRLGVRVGDQVELRVILSGGPALTDEEGLGKYTMTVRGLARGTFGAYESVFVDRRFLAEEAGEPRAASILLVYADDHEGASSLAARIADGNRELQARAWMDDSPYLRSSIRANKVLGAVSSAMVVAAVAIPVWALLYVNVLNRRRDVALLGATGFLRSEVFVVFLLQALVIGVAGVAGGCAIGWTLTRYFSAHPIFQWEGFVIRPLLSASCFVRPALFVLAATVFAGIYPAWRASRIDPARVLRELD